jgi:hypothetical protein
VDAGRVSAQAAQAEYQKRLDEKTAWKDRYTARVRGWVEAGHKGAPPQLVPDPAAESKLLTAELSAEGARAALAGLEAVARKARAELTAAESAVVAAVDELLGREYSDRLAESAHLLDEFLDAFAQVLALRETTGDEIHDANRAHRRLRATFDAARGNELDIPRGQFGMGMPMIVEAQQQLAERRRALITGH